MIVGRAPWLMLTVSIGLFRSYDAFIRTTSPHGIKLIPIHVSLYLLGHLPRHSVKFRTEVTFGFKYFSQVLDSHAHSKTRYTSGPGHVPQGPVLQARFFFPRVDF